MPVELAESIKSDVPIAYMKDGNVAVVTEWILGETYVGTVVQRYGYDLVALGQELSEGWVNFFHGSVNSDHYKHCRVMILPKGTNFKVT